MPQTSVPCDDSTGFIEPLKAGDLDKLRTCRKTDLHSHAILATRLEDVEAWAGVTLKRPPLRMRGLREMEEYISQVLNPHIRNREGFEFASESAVRHAVADGVRVLEMSFGSRACQFYPDGATGMISFVRGLEARCRDIILLRPEVGFMRRDIANMEEVDAVHAAIDSGVFQSLDLYSHEDGCSSEEAMPLFIAAKKANMKLKAHVGEFGGAEAVRSAVELLGLDAVQHGIGAAESPEVMRWLAERGTVLNICPTSNVLLGGVAQMSTHPIRLLYDHGVPVTVNTDDLMVFGQSVSEEFLNLHRAGILSPAELDDIRQVGLRVSNQ